MSVKLDEIKEAIGEKLSSTAYGNTPAAALKKGYLPPSISRTKDFLQNYRFADLTGYSSYDEEHRLFFNDDSYGFVLQISTLCGANEGVHKIVSGIFTQNLPTGTGVQFHLWASPQVCGLLTDWANMAATDNNKVNDDVNSDKRNTNAFRWLKRKRFEFLKQATHESIFADHAFNIRDFSLFVSVSFPASRRKKDDGQLFVSDTEIEEAVNHRNSIRSGLKAAEMAVEVLDAEDFINWLDDVLNPTTEFKRHNLEWNQGKEIKDQIIAGETNLLLGKDGMTIGDMEVRSYSVRSYPSTWALWNMSELIGDTFQNALRIPGHFLITFGVYIPDQEMLQKRVGLKAARATQNSESVMAKFNPTMKEQKRDWDFVTRKINDGGSLVYAYHQILLFNKIGMADAAEHSLKSLYRAKNWVLQNDRFMQIQGMLGALPMTLNQVFFKELKSMGRINMMLTQTAGSMVPAITEWKGTGTPTLMLFGRRGQIMFVDPFDNEQGNYNIACAAASGAGKSFWTQEFIVSILAGGGRAWVIDVGRSYENICEILDGQFVEFSENSKINVNPFTNIKDFADAQLQLKPLIATMAKPKEGTSDHEDSFISAAITEAWNEKQNKATITTVRDCLNREDDQRAKDLARNLGGFCEGGVYARFFEGECNLDFSNNFVVLELEELKSMKELQSVILMILMFQITEEMYLGNRDRRKICIIDEAWDLMKGGTGDFIESGYRRARKYGGLFMTVTQGINDYYKTAPSTAALENSDWLFMLRQKNESIDQLKKSQRISMEGDSYMERLIKSVTTSHGNYSEIFVYGPKGYAVGRLIVDKFSALLYSTKAEEFNAIKELKAKGYSLSEAIEAILSNRQNRAVV